MIPDNERLLAPDYLADLHGRPIEEIRAMRARCLDVETGLSFLRRMSQGPLDIVVAELRHREQGIPSDLAALIDELPDILADGPRAPGSGRLTQRLEPSEPDPELSAELDALLGSGSVAAVTALSDDDLRALAAGLTAFELKVSELRKAFHRGIDALQAELTRRYRIGEASVESLLG